MISSQKAEIFVFYIVFPALTGVWVLGGGGMRAPGHGEGKGRGSYLHSHSDVWGAQFPGPQFLEHFQEDVGPDSQVQVFPELLQFCQDLFGGAETLQIFREFGQEIKVPQVSRREGQLGGCREVGLAPQVLLSLPLMRCLQGSISLYLGDFPPPQMQGACRSGTSLIFKGSKSWSPICISLEKQIRDIL